MTIISDIHEPDELQKSANEIKDLGFDFLITGEYKTYYIERKEISDFVSSVYSSRIFYQLQRLKDCCTEPHHLPVLIIEGNPQKVFNRTKGKMSKALYYSTVQSIAETGIIIMNTSTITDTKILLAHLNNRAGRESEEKLSIKTNKKARNEKEEAYNIICSIKGVGQKTAKKLLEKHKTVRAIMCLSEQELQAGIGKKKGEHAYNIINYRVHNPRTE